MKTCPKCSKLLPESEFNKRCGDILTSYCKNCQSAYSKAHYQRNKTEHNKRRYKTTKERRSRMATYIREIKNHPCVDCGISYPYWAMEFDHLPGTVKEFTIARASSNGGVSFDRLREEIAKCDLVCVLCHRYRTNGLQRHPDGSTTPWEERKTGKSKSRIKKGP